MYRSPSGETARRESFGQPTVLHSFADRSGSPSTFGPVYLSDSHGSEEDGIKYGNQQRINIDLTGEDQEMLKERLDKEQQEIREYYRQEKQGKLVQAYIKRLDQLEQKDLDIHLEMCGITIRTREKVQEHKFEGGTWKQIMLDDTSSQTRKFIAEELDMDVGTYYQYRGNIKKHYKEESATIDEPPKPPDIEKGETLCSLKEWMNYKKNVITWLKGTDNEMAEVVTEITNNPWNVQGLDGFTNKMSRYMIKVNQKWGSSIEKSKMMGTVNNAASDVKDYTNDDGVSGIHMFKTLCATIAQKTPTRMDNVIKQKANPPTPKKPEQLYCDLADYYTVMCEEYKYQSGQEMPEIEKKHTLYKMAEALEKDGKYISTLTLPLADLRRQGNTTSEEVRKLLVEFSTEYGVRLKNGKKKTKEDAEEAQTERVHAFINHEQLNPLTYYKEPGMCISFRESQRCRGGPSCPYTHEGATNKVCTNEDYIRYGFCSNWYDCKDQHPYDAIKFGPRSIMLEKYREMRRKKQAAS